MINNIFFQRPDFWHDNYLRRKIITALKSNIILFREKVKFLKIENAFMRK